MKQSLSAGLDSVRRIQIDRARTIDFMGEDGRVYATPELVRDIEIACREFLLQHLDTGEDSVGIRVEVDHLAATLMGQPVEIAVKIAEVKGRQVVFEVVATDNVEKIAQGRHIRFVVDVEQTKKRLAAKAEKAKAGAR